MTLEQIIAALVAMGFSQTGTTIVVDQDAEVEFSCSPGGATARSLDDEFSSNAVWVPGDTIAQGYQALDTFLHSEGL